MKRLGRLAREARDLATLTGVSLWHGFLAFYNSDNLTYAASIAYYALLSLFPFLMLVLALIGRATAEEADRARVLAFVLRFFPTQFDFITEQLDAFRSHSLTLSVAGTLALLWGALGVFGAVTTAVDYAWGVEKARSYWKHKLFSFLMLIVAGALLIAALLLVSASDIVGASWFAGVASRFPGLLILRGWTIHNAATLLLVVVLGLVFYAVPNTRVRLRDVWIGAILTGLLWKGALALLAWYMRDMSRFTQVNGSIAAVIVFLIWVYVQAVILLYGVQFTAVYARMRRRRLDAAPPTG